MGSSTNGTTLYQFYVRAANGTVYKAVSSIPVNDFAWHHLVGVCDQAHTNVTLYIDGQVAAVTFIPAGSGINEASAPLTIGAGIGSGQTDYGTTSALQFVGWIDDVATYRYALSVGQVIHQYAATGNPVAVSFVPPPPTNVVYLANQTLRIPATIAGSATLGYYWTNLTVGGAVLASGGTNVGGSLNATLTISNAPASLNGDQLELVAFNDISSTNWFVTLFNPAPPVTLDYSSSILYSNFFNGGTWSIAGMPVTAANLLVGGTNATWIDQIGTNNTTGVMQANGTSTSIAQDGWVLPFTPHSGYVYTISASATYSGAAGNWFALGFFQNILTNATDGTTGKINGGAGGNGILIVPCANHWKCAVFCDWQRQRPNYQCDYRHRRQRHPHDTDCIGYDWR